MNCKTYMAVGVGAGYLLGRTKKLKLALMLGGLAAGKQLGASPGELLSRGASMARSSPQVKQLTDEVAGRLVDAGKTAAMAALTSRVEGLSDRLSDRTSSLRGGAADEDDQRDEYDEDEEPEDERDEYDEDEEPEDERDEYDEDEEPEDERDEYDEDEEPEDERDEYDEDEEPEDERDEYDEEPEPRPARRHSGRQASSGRSRRRARASSGAR